jgi:RNA polymerase primary sigma factor
MVLSAHRRSVVPEQSVRTSPLSAERERQLVVATEAGDADACRELVEAFLPAIAALARRYRSVRGVEHRELVQEGVVGLLRAARRYEERLETPFWAYASWWVRQAMQQLVAEVAGPIVLSDRAIRSLTRIREARRDYEREPSRAELATATGFSPDQVDSLLALEQSPRGLEEPAAEGATLAELIADPGAEADYERVLDGIELQLVRGLAGVLDERERMVLSAHYGLGRAPRTLSELAAELAVTAERVRQIEAGALTKLREAVAEGRR